jgi:hypothetical protein
LGLTVHLLQKDGATMSNEMDEFEAYLKTLPPKYGRKLSFEDKCGAAYALLKGERAEVIAKAFALSRATTSMLANALKPNGRAYRDVWREFYRLGEDAFAKTYYLPMHGRLARIRLELVHIAEPGDVAPRSFGPDPRADKYSYANVGLIEIPDNTRWRIDWTGDGWRIACPEQGVVWGADQIDGATDNPRPFRTSAEAFDGIYTLNGYADQNPRPKPGRRG